MIQILPFSSIQELNEEFKVDEQDYINLNIIRDSQNQNSLIYVKDTINNYSFEKNEI